jgi:hypothetical protein
MNEFHIWNLIWCKQLDKNYSLWPVAQKGSYWDSGKDVSSEKQLSYPARIRIKNKRTEETPWAALLLLYNTRILSCKEIYALVHILDFVWTQHTYAQAHWRKVKVLFTIEIEKEKVKYINTYLYCKMIGFPEGLLRDFYDKNRKGLSEVLSLVSRIIQSTCIVPNTYILFILSF